jgi:hypothetical protein
MTRPDIIPRQPRGVIDLVLAIVILITRPPKPPRR